MKVKMYYLSPAVNYFVLFILLDVAVKSQMSSNSNSHSFLQGSNEVRYIVDSIPVSVQKEFSDSPGAIIKNGDESKNGNLKFDPPLLDFKERHIGVSHHEKVTIINLNGNKTVHMSSISGNTVHFHSSFFENKVIPPLGNTSFNVVFLGREEGEIESNLFIHTSEGSFKYQVRGSSVQSPYRLRPLSGVRLPLNASFSSLIQMHNPYSRPLQLIEVYSSGDEFRLELPSGELEGPKNLWEIPAFLTKPIIRVRFHARAQKNHTAYIRLKVNNSEEVLVVPLEVEVGATCGLYTPEDVIDFGIGGSHDSPTSVNLWLHNSWKKPIKIQNVISTPVSKALKIDFQPVKVPPESDEAIKVAQLTLDWAVALETGHTSGRIVVKSKQSTQKLVIPYTATVLAGGLSYDGQVTRFRSDSPNNPPRTFQLTNNFKLPVAITNVSLPKDVQPYFEVSQFEPCILQPGQIAPLFQLTPSSSSLPDLNLDSTIIITSNVSTLAVPLLCYDGKLKKVISHQNESELELGTVGSGTEKQILFALVNENPVPVTILSWDTSLPSTSVALASIQDMDAVTYLSRYSPHNNVTQERSVGPGQHAIVRVLVHAGAQVGETQGYITLRTEYETIQVAAHMRVEHGSLQVTPDPIIFDDCFPGKVCTEILRVQSLFSVAMAVTGVSGDPGDLRLNFSPAAPPLLPPAATTTLGTLSFDTRLLPPEDNYLATTHNVTGGTRWQDTLELPAHCVEFDLNLMKARYNHFRNLSSRLLNLTLRLDTTEVREHRFGAQVRLTWPKLADDIAFPLTQVGNTTHRSLVLTNPGTQDPVMIQLVLLGKTYPDISAHDDDLPLQLKHEGAPGTGQFEVDASESEYRVTGDHIHRDTWTFLLPPSANTTVVVSFIPTDAEPSVALLLLRNNLTALETVQLTGIGAYAQFKFGNRKPGSTTPLLFELAEKHLKDCEREKQRKFPAPNLTVKRSFTARNTGALPISVYGFDISGLSCEGYGFRVLNCEAFSLPPNSTRKVDIAFTPDFTLARVQRTLGVWTSENDSAANYTLVATLPPFLLSTCSSVLARPAWEPLLYYCAVTFMVFLLVCVLAAAFLESNRALKCALMAMSRDTASSQPVLDLKSIGTGVGLASSNITNGNSSEIVSNPLLSSEKSEQSSMLWSKAPPLSSSTPSTTPPAPQEPEVLKEKIHKTEVESVAGVFTSPSSKCVKRKEKTLVSKRFSDPTDIACSERRSSWANDLTKSVTTPLPKSQLKSITVTSPEPSKSSLSESKRKLSKRNSNPGRYVREVIVLPVTSLGSSVGEDTETSSTTTESSHDDGDKEVEVTMLLRECDNGPTTSHKAQRSRGPKGDSTKKISPSVVTDRNAGSASSQEHEWEDEEPAEKEPVIKKTHNSSRNRKSSSKIIKSSENSQSGQSSGRSKNSGNKQANSRTKEKQTLIQKRSIEKLPSLPKPVVYDPPPPPLGLWDESRASFSDVVARSDATKHTLDQPLHPLNTQTPQIPATPPTLLGPIGSKKTYPGVWDHWTDSGELSSAPSPPTSAPAISTSSFFMDTFTDTRPSPVVQNASFDPGWAEQTMILKVLQAEEQRRLEAEEYQQQQQQQQRAAFHDTWSHWEPFCSGNVPANDSAPAPTNASLWGNNVWAPPPPPDTWAPPGLAPRPPPRLDDSELDVGLDYDLFRSLSNIWAPPHSSNNFWKPPTTNNN